jgi:hypothetical protein
MTALSSKVNATVTGVSCDTKDRRKPFYGYYP